MSYNSFTVLSHRKILRSEQMERIYLHFCLNSLKYVQKGPINYTTLFQVIVSIVWTNEDIHRNRMQSVFFPLRELEQFWNRGHIIFYTQKTETKYKTKQITKRMMIPGHA